MPHPARARPATPARRPTPSISGPVGAGAGYPAWRGRGSPRVRVEVSCQIERGHYRAIVHSHGIAATDADFGDGHEEPQPWQLANARQADDSASCEAKEYLVNALAC